MPKIVLSSPNIKSRALKELANELSSRLGYRVYRVTPDRVRRRINVGFHRGLDKITQLRAFVEKGVHCPALLLSSGMLGVCLAGLLSSGN